MGYFPNIFKAAIIKLLPKPNTDHTNPINYIPISLLEVSGKVLEKIINRRLIHHLEIYDLLPNTQHGFRRGTHSAVTLAHETVAHHIANKDQVYIVQRDVSKAFDKVWLQGLQYKISRLQLPNIITKFLYNFIIERKAKIKINTYNYYQVYHRAVHCHPPYTQSIHQTSLKQDQARRSYNMPTM